MKMRAKLTQLFLLAASASSMMTAYAVETPVVPGTSAKATALLNWLDSQQGVKIVSGQMERTPDRRWNPVSTEEIPINRIVNLTGKYPAMRGFDYTYYSPEYINAHPESGPLIADNLTQRAINWSQANGIVQIVWHWWMTGQNGKTGAYSAFSLPDSGTDFDISKAVVDGTPENVRFLAGIDAIAIELKKLDAAGVPVLWRPLHEGTWVSFWWGMKGPQVYKQAWKIMFNRLSGTNTTAGEHGLKNLIWMFNPDVHNLSNMTAWYPGDEYVDLITLDEYESIPNNHGTFAADYATIKTFAENNKLVTLGDIGEIPAPNVLAVSGPNWPAFMVWDDPHDPAPAVNIPYNTDAYLSTAYTNAYVLSRDKLPNLTALAAPTVGTATKLVFSRQPTNVYVGDSWSRPVYVAAVDNNNRIVRTKSGTVTLKNSSTVLGIPTLGATIATANLVNGVAKFTPPFSSIASNLKVGASMSGLTSITSSNSFSVGTASDTGKYTFENNSQGWVRSGAISTAAQSGTRSYAGTKSLKFTFSGTPTSDDTIKISSPSPAIAPGATVNFRVWIPFDSSIYSINAYVQQGASSNWKYTGNFYFIQNLTPGTWNTLSVKVPTDATPLDSIGLTFTSSAAWTGDCYLDSVTW